MTRKNDHATVVDEYYHSIGSMRHESSVGSYYTGNDKPERNTSYITACCVNVAVALMQGNTYGLAGNLN